MSTAVATQSKPKDLRGLLESQNVIAGISKALGGFMDAGNFLSQMLIAFQAPGSGDKPGVVDCTMDSKFKAAHVCATLGLLPTLGQVALIPRNMKDQGLCCTVMPQWQGFQALMLRHPDVRSVKATLVHSTDTYGYDPETESIVNHTYDPFDPKRTFNGFEDVRGGYLVVTYKDNRPKQYHCVKLDVFQKARKCAQGDGIWSKWFEEQCLKTVYRNAYARRVVPIDPFATQRIQALIESEDEALGNDPSRVVIESQPVITHKQSRTQKVAQRMMPAVDRTEEVSDLEQSSEAVSEAPAVEPEAKPAKSKRASADPFDVQIAKAVTIQELVAIEEAISEFVSAGKIDGDEATFYRSALAKKRKRFEGE